MDLVLDPEMEAYLVLDALRRRMREDAVADLREKLRLSEADVAAGRTVVADDAYFERKRQMIRDRYMRVT